MRSRKHVRKPRKTGSKNITVRVMWYSKEKSGEAEEIARAIENMLRNMGYKITSRSRRPNRENDGGRIYFTVIKPGSTR